MKAGEGDDRGWGGWMPSPTQWTWVWVNSGGWWWTGRLGVLQSMGSQRVGREWVTELNCNFLLVQVIHGDKKKKKNLVSWFTKWKTFLWMNYIHVPLQQGTTWEEPQSLYGILENMRMLSFLNKGWIDHFRKRTCLLIYWVQESLGSERKWKSISPIWLFATSWTIQCMESPGQNTGVGCSSLLQLILPTQGSNSVLPHCRTILYQLSHEGSARILEWIAHPFSRGSSRPRSQTGVSCIAGGFVTNSDTRETLIATPP